MNDRHAQRQERKSSPATKVIGEHQVFGRTPLDALSTFCDLHGWHAEFVPPPNVDALITMVYPIDHRREQYPVRVTRLPVTAKEVGNAPDGRGFVAYPGDYRITVLPW
jgi:hypothetical protein